jgi:hypothetical protein
MQPYSVYINELALQTAPRTGNQRTLVMNFVRFLAANPNSPGDFQERDEGGRTVQVKLVGRYAIIFWADHPVSEIKITHIKPADL